MTKQAYCILREYCVMTNHNYYSTAEHSCREGTTFSV